MTSTANSYARFDRFGFAAAVFAMCAVLFLLGIVPRSERALFLKDDKLLPAKAFSAVVPPLDAAKSQVEQSLLRSEDIRRSRLGGGGRGRDRGANNPQLASNSPSLLPETLPSLLSTGNAPGGESTPGGTLPGDGTPVPAGGQQSSTPTTTTPTSNPPSAPGLPTATAGAPAVAAVPEPATWMMMLLGFFAIGATVRRRAPSSAVGTATLA